MPSDAETFGYLGRVAPGAKIAVRKEAFGRINDPLACQLEVEPVLAMKRTGGFCQALGLMALQPCQLDRLLTGVESGACCRVMRGVIGTGDEFLGHLGRARVEPDQAVSHRFALGIDQPAAVSLARHCKHNRTGGETRHDLRQIAKRPRHIMPSAAHVLLDASSTETNV